MKIYPINQSPVMFRGSKAGNTTLKRYCEPRTGVYYYYDPAKIQQEKQNNGISKFFNNIFNKLHKTSEAISDTFTSSKNDTDDILWL